MPKTVVVVVAVGGGGGDGVVVVALLMLSLLLLLSDGKRAPTPDAGVEGQYSEEVDRLQVRSRGKWANRDEE